MADRVKGLTEIQGNNYNIWVDSKEVGYSMEKSYSCGSWRTSWPEGMLTWKTATDSMSFLIRINKKMTTY